MQASVNWPGDAASRFNRLAGVASPQRKGFALPESLRRRLRDYLSESGQQVLEESTPSATVTSEPGRRAKGDD